ncbi:hypothetical protein PLICRDRAFT_525494 [Plicaturopsis crispa FD-325 SS-3]|nr:hypothetical protein PLICRDRAFT_525494 [Plicaturopsis crispa FD-325 SS-3]
MRDEARGRDQDGVVWRSTGITSTLSVCTPCIGLSVTAGAVDLTTPNVSRMKITRVRGRAHQLFDYLSGITKTAT